MHMQLISTLNYIVTSTLYGMGKYYLMSLTTYHVSVCKYISIKCEYIFTNCGYQCPQILYIQ